MKNIGIIGQGFVGNAIFQKFINYYEVLAYDKDESKSKTSFDNVANNCSIIFLCLPTPMNEDGSCDIGIVRSVLDRLNKKDNNYTIVLKSTVIPGTTDNLNKLYENFSIVFNPEFLTERNAVEDFKNQSRIILGGPRPATTLIKQLYSKVFPKVHIIKTGARHAEMVKYFINSFLSIKISFANEMYSLSQQLDIDYDKIVEYSIFDERLGKTHFSVPGHDGDFGFGGHCLPKDLSAIIKLSEDLKTKNNVLKAAVRTNNEVRKNRDWEKMKGRAVN